MVEITYNINNNDVVHTFPKYYECDKNWFANAELKTKEFFINTIKENFNIIDAGAHVGMYSVLFGELANKGKVYAFEPTDTMDFLIENLKENKIENVELYKVALSNRVGNFTDKIFRVWSDQIIEHKEFEFETIDNFVSKKNLKIDLIKIDVDSYDYEVLQGCENFFKTQNPIVVVELNQSLGLRNYNIQQAIDLMKSYSYKVDHFFDGDNYVFTKE